MNIKEILQNPNNPRIIKDDKFKKLCQSIKDFPEMLKLRPIVIDENNMVLGGNMRLKACNEIGLKDVPTIQAKDLTEEQKKEFIIKDNIGFGEWNWEDLANEWDVENLSNWGVDLPLDFGTPIEATEDDYVIPDEIETDIVLGDLFEIGEHRLLCGDTRNPDELAILMNSQFADIVVTDPPYNVDYTGKTKHALKIENDKKSDTDFYTFLFEFYTALGGVTKKGGAWYVWHADSEGANFRKAMADAGIMVKQCLIWVKSSMVMGRQDYHWKHEPCLYGWKEGASHGWYADRKQTTILNFDRPNANKEHPTMKPVALIAYQITNSSKQGDIVADGFLGSGTTMVAANQLKRKCYGMEIDPKYCQVIVDRMKLADPTLIIKKNGIQQD